MSVYYAIAGPICLIWLWWLSRPRPFTCADLGPVTVQPDVLARWEQWTRDQLCLVTPVRDYRAIAAREALSARLDAERLKRHGQKVVEMARRRRA